MSETSKHVPVEFKESHLQRVEVDHEERIPEIDLDMEQSEKDQAKGAHVLAAMEKQFGPIDEELTELANRSTIDNDEYERV